MRSEMVQNMISGIEITEEDSVCDISVDEIQPDGLDPSQFQPNSVPGMPDFSELADIMANKESYNKYMTDRFGEEIESTIEFQIALKEGEIDQD